MLINGSRFIDAPVMSLQTGSEIAKTNRAVIDAGKLQVVAYQLAGPLLDKRDTLLRVVDVREFSDIGLIVDSVDELVTPDDIIKISEIYKLNFNPVGMRVTSTKGKALGRVYQYTLDTQGFYIVQLGVKPVFFTRIREAELLIHRSQIKEINDRSIVIEERQTIREEPALVPNTSYVNPFRSRSEPQPDSTMANHPQELR